ncbi:MAG: GrpB family protein [Cytophagales bacterium]|nr:MAG: GrpB family protein [Cytophagales bacterium]
MLIEAYTSKWVDDFADIKREIDLGLRGLDYQIEHVGSTSVPNLAAKAIIDIDIIYPDQADFGKIKLGLEGIGYYHNGNQGIEDRDVFKRSGKQTSGVLDTVTHHLYVGPIHSKALERHLLSRDFLRKNDWARLEYQRMKYELAEKANQDRKMYAHLKELTVNEFIDSIIAKERSERSTPIAQQ